MMTSSFLGFARAVSMQTEERRGETLSPTLRGKQARPEEGCVARCVGAGKAECLGRSGPLSKREGVRRKGEEDGMGHGTPDPGRTQRRPQQGRWRAGPQWQAHLTPSLPAVGKQGQKGTCHRSGRSSLHRPRLMEIILMGRPVQYLDRNNFRIVIFPVLK